MTPKAFLLDAEGVGGHRLRRATAGHQMDRTAGLVVWIVLLAALNLCKPEVQALSYNPNFSLFCWDVEAQGNRILAPPDFVNFRAGFSIRLPVVLAETPQIIPTGFYKDPKFAHRLAL